MPMNLEFLSHAKAMILVKLKGWETSWDIQQYLNVCEEEKILVHDLFSENIDSNVEKLIHHLSEINPKISR